MSVLSARVRADKPLRVLMLVPHSNVRGPIPTLVRLLVGGLSTLGCSVETERWSRHSDHESLLAKVAGRAADTWRIYARLRRGRFDVLYITTAHTRAGLLRDIPLVLATRRVCPHRVIHFHGSYSDQLSAPVPPLAVIVNEYGLPVVPPGSAAVAIASVAGLGSLRLDGPAMCWPLHAARAYVAPR